MDLPALLATQTGPGARYSAAAAELHDARIELAAIDEALQSGAVGYDGAPNVRSFHDLPQNLNQARLAHPQFAVADVAVDWREEIKAKRDDILASFNR